MDRCLGGKAVGGNVTNNSSNLKYERLRLKAKNKKLTTGKVRSPSLSHVGESGKSLFTF